MLAHHHPLRAREVVAFALCITTYNYFQCLVLEQYKVITSLFRNKRFALNEMFQRNDSKFAIFLFCFSFRPILYFYLMNALVYVNIDQGIHKVKYKVARNEKQKKLHGFSYT